MNQVLKVFIEDIPNSRTPILTHCRKLLKEGYGEDSEVWFYRKNTKGVQVIVRNLGLCAKLTVSERSRLSPRFVLYTEELHPYAKKTQTPHVE